MGLQDKLLREFTAFDYPYDKQGRGMSPETALRWETLVNILPFQQEGTLNPRYSSEFVKQGLYPVNPEFVNPGYSGSGTFYDAGPYKNKILLNTNRPLQEITSQIIPHELLHKEMSGMGGITRDKDYDKNYMDWLDNFLNSINEEKRRYPGERIAYGMIANPMNTLLEALKYYLPGDLNRSY